MVFPKITALFSDNLTNQIGVAATEPDGNIDRRWCEEVRNRTLRLTGDLPKQSQFTLSLPVRASEEGQERGGERWAEG